MNPHFLGPYKYDLKLKAFNYLGTFIRLFSFPGHRFWGFQNCFCFFLIRIKCHLEASIAWSGLNVTLASASEEKNSKEIKGGSSGEGSKREGSSLL